MARHPLVVKLKSGEYDGKDLMEAWLLIERQQTEIEQLHEANAEAYDAGRDSLEEELQNLRSWIAETITRVPPERYTELSPGLRDWWIAKGSRRRSESTGNSK